MKHIVCLHGTGFYDQIIGNLNNIYRRINTDKNANPLLVNAEALENFYTSLTGPVEISAAMMDIGNRVSKIHGNFLDNEDMGYNYREKLQNAYARYIKEFKGTNQDILEVISSIEEYSDDEYVSIHDRNQELILRNRRKDKKYLIKCSDKAKFDDVLEMVKNEKIDLGDFYKYIQSKELETLAYQIKAENLVELIKLQSQNPEAVQVKDATIFDSEAKEANDDQVAIQIEIPGFSAPYRVHSYKSKINNLLGRDPEQDLGLERVEGNYFGANHLPYRLSSEQIEYLEKLSSGRIISDRKAGSSVEYMKRSIEKLRGKIEKESKQQSGSKEKDDVTNDTENTSKRSLKISSTKKDIEFLESLYSKASQMGINLSDEYKFELSDKRGRTSSLSSIYKYIENYISMMEASKGININTEEAKRLIEEKSVKMYIYMKTCTRKFWGITDKNKRDECLEAGYDEEKIEKTIDGIKSEVKQDELPEYVTGKKVKTKVGKKEISMSGEDQKTTCEKKKVGYTNPDGSLEQRVEELMRARILEKKEQLERKRAELAELIKRQQEELTQSENEMAIIEKKLAGLDALSEEYDNLEIGDD